MNQSKIINLLIVFGTRPEAIKLAPLINKAKKDPRFKVVVCSTGQHREMLKPILNFFDIVPDFDLDLMKPGQTLVDISNGVLLGVSGVLESQKIDIVVVQGDTTTCLMAGLAAFYQKIPVAHVEAGLRSGDLYSPFPEEFNRRAAGLMAKYHFAPTIESRNNLLHEHYKSEDIFITGNTGIDALLHVMNTLKSSDEYHSSLKNQFSFLNEQKKLILVTIHRRESFGKPMIEIMKGLLQLSKRTDVEMLIPLHMNPHVRESAKSVFGDDASWVDKCKSIDHKKSKLWLCEPLDYIPFVYLMNRAHLIITDSGGVQEEAPSLGKPILVAREKTERPEAITAGTSSLIPLNENLFVETACRVLDSESLYNKMAQAKNPFGDGKASEKILEVLASK